MKKIICLLLVAMLLFGAAVAESTHKVQTIYKGQLVVVYTSGDYGYIVRDNDTALILNYNGEEETVIVPAELDGHAVTEIDGNAFRSSDMVSVFLPDSIISPDANIFGRCYSLAEVNVSLKNPDLESVDGVLFSKKDRCLVCYPAAKESEVYIVPQGTQALSEGAFSACEYLTEVILPDGLKIIGNEAFAGCYCLKALNLPDGLTTIGDRAFADCEMKEIVIPDSVTEIGINPFQWWFYDQTVCVSDEHPLFAVVDGALYDKTENKLISYLGSDQSFSVPLGTEIIGERAFDEFERLTDITFPDSLKKICASAFSMCSGLRSISFAEGLVEIDRSAFYACDSLTALSLPKGLERIGDGAFRGCGHLQTVEIAEGLEVIGNNAFTVCYDLEYISLPSTLKTIGSGAFSYCRNLREIVLPESLTEIKDRAFEECTGLTSVALPAALTEMGVNPFLKCEGLTEIRVSADNPVLASIDGVLFVKTERKLLCYPAGRQQSTYVIPQGIREIAQDAFYRAAAIGEIVLPDSLEKIGKEAFLYCSMLTRVSDGSGLSEIGNSAFYGCENLNQVTLPVTLTKIGEQAFSRCPNLILAVYRDSYALEYCRENALKYSYTDSQDWLKD